MSRLSFIAALLALCAGATAAEPVRIVSGPERVALVELYTSEGCSSCPPADEWLSELRTDPRLWKQVVPVAFHVDYWDYIGWPDRFAGPANSERQREYARQGHLSRVYTPGLVVAGQEWRGWFSNPALRLTEGAPVGTLALTADGDRVVAVFQSAGFEFSGPATVHVALLGMELSTPVRAGENNGRTLNHDFVVLSHTRTEMSRDGDRHSARLHLPAPHTTAEHLAVAGWISAGDDQRPIQAAGGWLTR